MRNITIAILAIGLMSTAPDAQDFLARAKALHKQSPLIDGHNDYPWALRENNIERDINKLDIKTSQPSIMTDIPRLREGGLGGQFWSVYVPATMQGQTAVRATFEQIDIVHRMVRKYPETFELARTAADDGERNPIGVVEERHGADARACVRTCHVDEERRGQRRDHHGPSRHHES